MKNIIEKFKNLKVLVVGDVMIDAYLFGKVERISPEAPVPVVAVSKKENRLGGAANVALNLVSLGAKPILCSVIGDDKEGTELIQLLKNNKIGTEGIVVSKKRITTVKTRVIAQSHHMMRIDNEHTENLNSSESANLLKKIFSLSKNADVLVFEDYDKGVLDANNISQIIKKAIELNVPVAVDPKKNNFTSYKGATLFKPNLKELREGFRDFSIDNKAQFEAVVKDLMKQMKLKNLFVTMSERGVMITDGKKFEYVPAHLRKISDVSGAGDTVIAVASLCLALKQSNATIAQLSNLAGGLVCEEVGVVPIDKKLLIDEVTNLGL
ncbi:MAG: bifunctional ADP-heptose synthase [Bacteroidota bacterium]